MERSLNAILYNDAYNPPYVNHTGWGNATGAGNKNGCGNGYVNYNPRENYNGKDIIEFNGNKTLFIQDYLLYIKNFRFPWIKGEIIKNDFTTQPCYFTNLNNKIAIASSIKEVFNELKNNINHKKYNDADVARAFVICHPEYEGKYKWGEMVEWLTLEPYKTSNHVKIFTKVCKKRDKNLVTPKEFIELIYQYSSSVPLGREMKKLYTT